ncbi:beta-ketoacyl synthase N-terminal-like domain-containing protein, partial [Actinomadura roseirufa]|uniref:beta-ketoacyl synthase N-terminal-like domain-containing protein n=1 Tax=Actinomadura roseirufa TaxID=2094049 RepID=UPI001A9560D4
MTAATIGRGTATAVAPLVITGCGVISPAGLGLEALAAAQNPGATDTPPTAPPTAPGPEALGGDLPPVPLAAAPDPRVEDFLGKRGTRALDRTTRLALAAVHGALDALGGPLSEADRGRTGIVIGSGTGSVRSFTDFTRETLVRDKPYLVRANHFPTTAMNFCAGQIAIWNDLRGVNTTLAGGRVSALSAVRYARNAIVQGHIDRALVGSAEELSAQAAWAWHHAGALAPGAAVGEGAAVFAVETPTGAAAAGRA